MADREKATPDTHTTSAPEAAVDSNGQVILPQGWLYKRPFGSGKLPWYASPQTQITLVALVCFMCPGMSTLPTSLHSVQHH